MSYFFKLSLDFPPFFYQYHLIQIFLIPLISKFLFFEELFLLPQLLKKLMEKKKKEKEKEEKKKEKNECTRLPELSYVFCKNKKTSQVIKSERNILISEGDENPNKICK